MTGLAQRLTPPGSVPYPGNHLGLRWRPMIGRDAPAVYALISLIEDDDNAIRRTSVDDIADMMEGENGRDWVDTIVGLDAKRNICAVASVRVLRGIHEAATAVVSAFIHPHWRGRGVGRALLYWQDGRARQMLVEAFGAESEVPASISNLVDAHMTDRRRLYIAAGFFAKRTCLRATDIASCRGARFRRSRSAPSTWRPSSSRSVRRCAPCGGTMR